MSHRKSLWLPVLVAVLAIVSLVVPRSQAETAGPAVVRVYYRDQAHLDAVAGALDIWESHPDQGYVLAAVTPDQQQWLAGLGYRLETDAEKTALLGIQAPLDARFHYFDGYYLNPNGLYVVDFLQATNAAHPDQTEDRKSTRLNSSHT